MHFLEEDANVKGARTPEEERNSFKNAMKQRVCEQQLSANTLNKTSKPAATFLSDR